MKKNKILITGVAGFIGFHVCRILLDLGHAVVGLDNINGYYSVQLKLDRLKQLGIEEVAEGEIVNSKNPEYNFKFIKLDLENRNELPDLFNKFEFDIVCNLAAQAGVRYSLENPNVYIDANIVGFVNLLESMRKHHVKKLIYASSSSVYGMNEKVPFETTDRIDQPISLYAATKKSNELLAYTYSHLYEIQCIGLRFFTEALFNNKPIKVFNEGKLSRDFTFIDDIVEGVKKTILEPQPNNKKYSIYNIGNGSPVQITDFIKAIEKNIGKEAKKQLLPMQPGDVEKTWADTTNLENDYGYAPNTDIDVGVKEFIDWYKKYYRE